MGLFNEIRKIAEEETVRREAARKKVALAKEKADERKRNPDINRIIRDLPAFLERAALDGCRTGVHTLDVMILNEKDHLIITDFMREEAQKKAFSGTKQITADILLEGVVEIRNVLQKSVIPLIDYLENEGFEVSIKSREQDDPGSYCPTMENYISVSW